MLSHLLSMFRWTGGGAKVHESKFRVLPNEICLSCVCAEGTSPFSAAWQQLKIVQLRNVKRRFKNSL